MSRLGGTLLQMGVLIACVVRPLGAEQGVRQVQVEVRGRTVHALCTDGPRSVVLLHGEAGDADSWRPVLERLAGEVGACAYDRSGAGVGEPGATRGWFELMDELRAVHTALGFERGYTLVGHSIAGMYARLFAADRPPDLGGLVLIDPAHEDMPDAVAAGMPARAWSRWMADRERPNEDGVREADLARHARGRRLPDIPVTVITASERRDGDGWEARFLDEGARRVHGSILRGVRLARHIPASGSGHEVPLEAPHLVAGEIVRMVRMTTQAGR